MIVIFNTLLNLKYCPEEESVITEIYSENFYILSLEAIFITFLIL